MPSNWVIFRLLNGFLWLFETRKTIKSIRPDLLDVHFITVSGYLGLASGFHPFIINVWGNDILVDPRISIFYRWPARAVLKKADLATCITRIQYNALLEYIPASKIKLLPFSVDCEVFKPRPENKGPGTRKTIGVVKGMELTYGIEYLIKAIPYIAKEFKELEVLIVGGGDSEPYQRIARELGVKNFIKFVGKVPHGDVPQYLALMDVFVMPTVYESFGVAALEAQSMEVPVVASNVGGIPEAVSDGSTGILVEPKNPKAIADAVIRLLSDDALREKMGKNGREFVLKNYNWAPNMEEREKLYRELVEKSRKKISSRTDCK